MAIDLKLEHVGGGQFRCRTRLDFDLCTREFGPGEPVRASITKRRSVRQNAFFHALVGAAFENQRSGPRCETAAHLKSWLLIEAGHCDEVRLSVAGMNERDATAVARGMTAELKRRFDTVAVSFDPKSREIVMRFARSVSFRAADAEMFSGIVDRVAEIICAQIVPGTTPEQLFSEARERS